LAQEEHAATGTQSKAAVCLCDFSVLLGGLTLRCLILFAALPIWNGTLS